MTDQNEQQTFVKKGSHTGRKWGVGILLFLGLILLVLANVAFWAYFTLLNTNGWVAAIGPLSKDPAVAGIVSQYVVGELFAQADIQADVAEALPPELQLFAGPMVVGLENVADQAVTALVMSEAFNNIWVAFNRVSHTAIINILKGQGDRLYFLDGNLTLDFNDVYNFIQDRLGIDNLELVPQADEGRLVLFSSRQVAVMQEVVSYLTALGLLLPLLTILVFGAAVWMSFWRRQTVIWIGAVMAFAMFISLIVFAGVRSSAMVSISDPFLREIGRAIVNNLTHGLMVQTIFFMIVGIGLIIGGWQAAPDSALRQWEASRKERKLEEAAEQASEDTYT
jgi:FtsH-binding integral membrane protein